MSRAQNFDQEYWNSRWENQQLGWDIGYPSPALTSFMDQYPDKDAAILIPGCGNAYEAGYLLEHGFRNLTLIDIAENAVEKLQKQYAGNANISVLLGDFFDHQGSYNLILEQTFFCALDPLLRPDYVQKMAELLLPDGLLTGLLFRTEFQRPGPPFGGNEQEYRNLFQPAFDLQIMEPCRNSIPERQGNELFIKLRKKNEQN